MKYNELVSLICTELKNRNLLFFVGAGISKKSPSSIPSSYEIKKELFDAILQIVNKSTKICCDKDTKQSIINLPFESFMQSLYEVLQDKILSYLSFMQYPLHNENHSFLISLAYQSPYCAILTTNFDTMLEKVANKNYSSIYTNSQFSQIHLRSNNKKIQIIKLHGSATSKSSLSATLSSVGKPISFAKLKVFEKVCLGTTLVFLGYSGSNPDLMPVIEKINAKKIIWVCKKSPSLGVSPYVKKLKNEGRITIVTCDIQNLLKKCVESLNLKHVKVNQIKSIVNSKPIQELFLNLKPFQMMWCLALLSYQANRFNFAEKIFSWLSHHTPRDEYFNERKVSIYDRRGDVAYRIRNFKKAKYFFKKQLFFAERSSDSVFKVSALVNMGALEYQIGHLKEASTLLQKGRKIESNISGNKYGYYKWKLMGSLRLNMGLIYLKSCEYKKAKRLIGSAYKYFLRCGDIVMSSMSMIDYELANAKSGRKNCLKTINKALYNIECYGMIEQQAVVYETVAQIYLLKGESPIGEKYLRKSFQCANIVEDKFSIVESGFQLLKILLRSNRNIEASRLLLQINQIMASVLSS